MKMKLLLLLNLMISVFASEERENEILVKIEEDEYAKTNSPKYIGVSYSKRDLSWCAVRWSKNESKTVSNGTSYKNEETAAHASDTLARKLIANGEKGHKLNFPDDDTEVYREETERDNYIGLAYNKKYGTWCAQRHSKNENKTVSNGTYKDEETAANASDTLARKLIANGEKGHKFNFPDDDTEVYPEKTSNYIGLAYNKQTEKWRAQRWSKTEHKIFHNGYYKNEETAAHASDTLARKLIANGEKGHNLNFPEDDTENQTNKRKRPADFQASQPYGISLDKFKSEENENNVKYQIEQQI